MDNPTAPAVEAAAEAAMEGVVSWAPAEGAAPGAAGQVAAGAAATGVAEAAAAAEDPRGGCVSVGRPVGLPNLGTDCFWLAPLQCLRHTPGFAGLFSSSLPSRDVPAASLQEALADLLRTMESAEQNGSLSKEDGSLAQFRVHASKALPSSDQQSTLVQPEPSKQRQGDSHEFLSQLLDVLGGASGEQPPSPRASPDSARIDQLEGELTQVLAAQADVKVSQCPQGHPLELWLARAGECDGCFRQVAKGERVLDCRECNWYLCRGCFSQDPGDSQVKRAKLNADNLLWEYSAVHWSASATRMHSRSLSSIFEGQRLAALRCSACGRCCASSAEPFVMETVKVASCKEAGWLESLSSWLAASQNPAKRLTLAELLLRGAESPLAEGFRCPNASCAKVGSSSRTARFLRLPAVFVVHVDRAEPDDSRCELPLEFDEMLDLGRLGLVAHFGQPLDRNLEACSMRYRLASAVFHRRPSKRMAHYFAYVRAEDADGWVRVDDSKVVRPSAANESTPMALEASEPHGGARAALLFFHREGYGG